MVKISINLNDDLWKKVQIGIIERKGKLRGYVTEAFEEALLLWLGGEAPTASISTEDTHKEREDLIEKEIERKKRLEKEE